MKSFALSALLAISSNKAFVKAQDVDNSEEIAAGLGLICTPPQSGNYGFNNPGEFTWDSEKNGEKTLESCYAFAKDYVIDQYANGGSYDECFHAIETAASDGVPASFSCWNTYQNTKTYESIDIRTEVSPAEDGVTYHAWQWNQDTPLTFDRPSDEEPVDEEEEEEAGHMLATSAVAAAALILSQV